jgi:cytochrome bd ubiquinol oxidase subunit I
MDIAIADRVQFAFTIMFHYLFPIGTMGLAPFVAWFTWRGSRGDEQARRLAIFWTKIFAVNFATGVVTGIPMEFQFGTNWAQFSAKAGDVVGPPLTMEGIYAFFLESTFLGILLYGRSIVKSGLFVASAVLVWLGSWLSGFFIVVTDAWMQHPVGYTMLANGRIELRNLAEVLFQPYALWQYAHVLCGALVTGSFILAGIGAYYLLARRDEEDGRRLVRTGMCVGAVCVFLAMFPTGDENGREVTVAQPVKLAAMEGLFQSTTGAPLAIIGMPDEKAHDLIDPIFVPDVLSFLTYGNFRANVQGLSAYAHALWPPVSLTYYAYHIMVGLGTIFFGVSALAVLLLWRKKLFRMRWFLWLVMLVMPFPYIANEAGWVVTEVGRQPWIVYGLVRTADATSANVSSGETIFTLIGFVGMYFLLGTLFLFLTLREIAHGPDHHAAAAGEVVPA